MRIARKSECAKLLAGWAAGTRTYNPALTTQALAPKPPHQGGLVLVATWSLLEGRGGELIVVPLARKLLQPLVRTQALGTYSPGEQLGQLSR